MEWLPPAQPGGNQDGLLQVAGRAGHGPRFRPPGDGASGARGDPEPVHALGHATHDTCVLSRLGKGVAALRAAIAQQRHPELEASNLVSDRIGVICNRNHPFAIRAQPIPTHELDGNTFIALSKQNGLRAVIDREKRLPEICKRPQYEASVVHLIKPMIKDGIGIALLPAMASRSITDKDVVYVPLKAAVWRHVHFVTHKGRSLSPAAAHLKKLVLEQLSRFKGDSMVRVSESNK